MKDEKKEPIEETAEAATEEKAEPTAEERIAALEAELKEKDDKYLRMAAEYDNFRRRSREEKAAVYADALADTVGELLPIIDNLERAAMYDDGEKVKEGLMMTAKSVSAVLEKLGIETVGAAGETFDPNLHNAVFHVEDESYSDGEIVEVFQKGYKKGNKIIRFAMVKTAN
jgi:molecular chaperone GrpE